MGKEITSRQKELLTLLLNKFAITVCLQAYRKWPHILKVKSKNGVAKLLNSFEEQGYIKTSGKARGIEVLNSLGESLQKGLVAVPLLGQHSGRHSSFGRRTT